MSSTRTRTTLAATLAGAALGVVLLAGCGAADASGTDPSAGDASATPAASAGGPDPCTLLHDDEASALLHGPVTRSGPEDGYRGRDCKWETADGGLVSVQVYQGQEFYAPNMQAPGAPHLTGVGDDAYVQGSMGGARVGDTVVVVNAFGSGTDGAVESALRTAVSRLRA